MEKAEKPKRFRRTKADIENGIMIFYYGDRSTKRAFMAAADQVICMVDSSKFRSVGMVRECGLDSVDIIITDSGLTDRERTALARSTRAQIDIV